MNIATGVLSLGVSALFVISCVSDSLAGFERRGTGARSLGTAETSGAFGEDAWSFYSNPARAADISEIGFFYSPSTFGLSEVKSMGVAYRTHFFSTNVSGAVQSFGFSLYRETVFSLGVSLPLFDFLFLGSNINLNQLYIGGYGSAAAASFDIGGKTFLSDHFLLSFSTTNISSATMTLSNDRLPQTFATGMSYLSEIVNIGTEYYKELGFPSAARIAAEFSPVDEVTFRVGSSSGTNSFSVGCSLCMASFRVDYGLMVHQILGLTHSIGISILFTSSEGKEFESIRKYRAALRDR